MHNFDILFDIFFWELENIVAKLVLIAWPFRYHDISFKYPLLVYLVEIPSFSSDGRAIVSGAESMVGFLPNSGRYIGGSGGDLNPNHVSSPYEAGHFIRSDTHGFKFAKQRGEIWIAWEVIYVRSLIHLCVYVDKVLK